ncbi:HAMP domain-containing sensor histidine kinase [Flavisolibacter ginsenosidimutans]|uniref:histidine kinase n=1 Tax=Flavisolibacter ginsenosidimutans TaxID=661481 RepID=A0A5B8UJ15_9BACT|nr:HAMP domain-containing sensor histidine kinase [Flavisolibacter ginsenosidimutans]QEC56149.1 HAMP domain-containing histidine kinase [Flavisolibacter ginsenosidimutans]
MPVRLRITLIFSGLVFVILLLVCSGIYYFSYKARISAIKTRLINRAITTARLLSQHEIFDRNLMQRIDSSTTLAITNKVVQAYDNENRRIYRYSDAPNDTLTISDVQLDEARTNGSAFFESGEKEAVAYSYADNQTSMVMAVAGEDVEGRNNLDSLLRILIVSFLVGNILVLISGYFFSNGLLLPIKKISEDVAEISAQNLARRIKAGNTKDEWHQLSVTLNELLNRLQDSFEMQRRFIANASHELSTPLTAISSQLEVALQRERAAEEYRSVMQSTYQDVQHLNKLTQTLLEFAKASGNAGGLEIDLVRIDEVLMNLPAAVSKTNTAYSVLLEFDAPPENEESLLVFGNEELLMTALKNIVVNACKYSDDHRAVVTLRVSEANCFVYVKDNGPGIADAEREKIFQPFYRIEDNRFAGGFGLGLPLAQRIIKIHKGAIEIESDQEKGTVVTVQLPLAKTLQRL